MTTPDTPTFEWLNDNLEPYCPGKELCHRECDETCPVYANNMGTKLFEEGRIEEAKELFKRAIVATPDDKNGAAWFNLGLAYNRLGYTRDSFESFKNAWCINPNVACVYEGLAVSYACFKEYDKALEWCDKYAQKFGEEGIAKTREKVIKKMNGNV